MIDGILTWIATHQTLTLSLAALSAALFIGSLLSLPFLVSRIPADYFLDAKRHHGRLEQMHPMTYLAVRVAKNLLGWLLLVAGIAMLVLPGQGLLTILTGLVLCDFPGKYNLERRLASNPRILGSINWLRRRGGHAPLLAPFAQQR
jgi:hypothetical protein